MLKELLDDTFELWRKRSVTEKPGKGSPVYDLFKDKMEPAIDQAVRELGFLNFSVKASVGIGTWATIPWIGIKHDEAAKSFEQGVYVVYLFSPDFSRLYLSIIQGASKFGSSEIERRATLLRRQINRPETFGDNIEYPLAKDQRPNSNPDKYRKGSIYTKTYETIPNDELLKKDLHTALEAYQDFASGFKQRNRVFWKFSPGSRGVYWDEFLRREIIAMGSWGQRLGNLNQYPTVEDMRKIFPGLKASKSTKSDSAHQLIRFRDEIKPGHIIVAYRRKTILGFGRIPKDGVYDYDEEEDVDWWEIENEGLQHWRKVDWIKIFVPPFNVSGEEELYKDLSRNDTIHKVDPALNRRLEELMQLTEAGSERLTREHLEKAIKAMGLKREYSKEAVLSALERVIISENMRLDDDWKSKAWKDIVKWADEQR